MIDKDSILTELTDVIKLAPKSKDIELDYNRFKIIGITDNYNADLIRIENKLGDYENLEESAAYTNLESEEEREKANLELYKLAFDTSTSNYESCENNLKKAEDEFKKYKSEKLRNQKEILSAKIASKDSKSSSEIKNIYSTMRAIDKVIAENDIKALELKNQISGIKQQMKNYKAQKHKAEKNIRKSEIKIKSLQNKKSMMEKKNKPTKRDIELQARKKIIENKLNNLSDLGYLLEINVRHSLREARDEYKEGLMTDEEFEERLSEIRAYVLLTQKTEEKPDYLINLENVIAKLPKKNESKYSNEKIKELKGLYNEVKDSKVKKNKVIPVPIARFKISEKIDSNKLKNHFTRFWEKSKKTLKRMALGLGVGLALAGAFGIASTPENQAKSDEYVTVDPNHDPYPNGEDINNKKPEASVNDRNHDPYPNGEDILGPTEEDSEAGKEVDNEEKGQENDGSGGGGNSNPSDPGDGTTPGGSDGGNNGEPGEEIKLNAGDSVLVENDIIGTEAAGKTGTTIVDENGNSRTIVIIDGKEYVVDTPDVADATKNADGSSDVAIDDKTTLKIGEGIEGAQDTFGSIPATGDEEDNSIVLDEAAQAALDQQELVTLDYLNGTNYSGQNPTFTKVEPTFDAPISVDPIEQGIVR